MGGITVNEAVFKAYDIRGLYPKEFDKKFAYQLGKAFVEFTKSKEIVVGFDGRNGSKQLFDSLTKGLTEQGASVTNIGLVSTPQFFFAVFNGKYDGGIIITASHNPKQYNGFKLTTKNAEPIYSENGLMEVMDLMKNNKFSKPPRRGRVKKKDFSKEYTKFLKGFLPGSAKDKQSAKELKLVIDQSNGSGAAEVSLLKSFFPKAKVLNARISGSFPGHDPNPMKPEARKRLVSEVKKVKADLGVIFDGDADRVCFIDEKGGFVRPDLILCLLADELRKGKVVYDTRSSKVIPELCARKSLEAVMSKSGRTYIMHAMKNENAVLGGEGSGHYFFREFKYLDNASIAAIKALNRVLKEKASGGKSFSGIMSAYNTYHHSGELNFKVKNQSKAFLLVEQAFSDARKTLFIDGISVYYDDFWFNVRKSNTEPLIRVNAEANTSEGLKKVTQKLQKIMSLAK